MGKGLGKHQKMDHVGELPWLSFIDLRYYAR